MRMNRKRNLCFALAALSLASIAQAAPPPDESTLPLTLRRDYVGPVVGPADDRAYARGALGLIRPSYGRASLYVAWRVIHLPTGAVAREAHDRKGSWIHGGPFPQAPGNDEIATWLQARTDRCRRLRGRARACARALAGDEGRPLAARDAHDGPAAVRRGLACGRCCARGPRRSSGMGVAAVLRRARAARAGPRRRYAGRAGRAGRVDGGAQTGSRIGRGGAARVVRVSGGVRSAHRHPTRLAACPPRSARRTPGAAPCAVRRPRAAASRPA